MNEFEIIAKYFRPLTQGNDLLQDDAAVLAVPDGHELVVTSDTLNAGTHFMDDAAPDNIARKALRVNLSDLAAMGAKPLVYQLNIAFPKKPDEVWLKSFTDALHDDQKTYGIYCSGGDTTSINGPLSISITAMGFVPKGKAVYRKGAQAGDHIILTGPIGDALIGLHVLQKKIKTLNDDYFVQACYKPNPRTAVANILQKYAKAGADISDGLVADLGHICTASNCGAVIRLQPGLFSAHAEKLNSDPAELLTGGDDYELVLAASPDQSEDLLLDLAAQGLKPLKIGEFTTGQGVTVMDKNNAPLTLESSGWQHF